MINNFNLQATMKIHPQEYDNYSFHLYISVQENGYIKVFFKRKEKKLTVL